MSGAATLAGAASVFSLSESLLAAPAAAKPQLPAFLEISKLLTARQTLNDKQSERIFDALSQEDPTFTARFEALKNAVAKDRFVDIKAFAAFTERNDPQVKATAISIISAWYLGHTGEAASHSSVDNTRFIAFRDALMYEPTIDATVIPTFSRGRTNYWVEPPASLATD